MPTSARAFMRKNPVGWMIGSSGSGSTAASAAGVGVPREEGRRDGVDPRVGALGRQDRGDQQFERVAEMPAPSSRPGCCDVEPIEDARRRGRRRPAGARRRAGRARAGERGAPSVGERRRAHRPDQWSGPLGQSTDRAGPVRLRLRLLDGAHLFLQRGDQARARRRTAARRGRRPARGPSGTPRPTGCRAPRAGARRRRSASYRTACERRRRSWRSRARPAGRIGRLVRDDGEVDLSWSWRLVSTSASSRRPRPAPAPGDGSKNIGCIVGLAGCSRTRPFSR